jgi:hypothetical protein
MRAARQRRAESTTKFETGLTVRAVRHTGRQRSVTPKSINFAVYWVGKPIAQHLEGVRLPVKVDNRVLVVFVE